MPRLGVDLRLRVAAITLALLLPCVTSSWAAASKEEICDVDADFALGLEDYPAAIALHRKVLRAHNDDALAHYHLGFAYGMTGHSRDEISEYVAAAKLGLNKWDLFLNLGIAYLEQSDVERAVNALETATMLGPNHSEPHFNLAVAYERAGKLHQARQEISLSLRLSPDDPDARNTLAIIYIRLGAYQLAYDEWAYLVLTAPGYKIACANLVALSERLRKGSIQISAVTPSSARNKSSYEKSLLNDPGAPNSFEAAAIEEECEGNGMSNMPPVVDQHYRAMTHAKLQRTAETPAHKTTPSGANGYIGERAAIGSPSASGALKP